MKLASLKDGRDGRLIVVSDDMTLAAEAGTTMQAAMDDWDFEEGRLRDLHAKLGTHEAQSFAFEPRACASPLPRAYQWADGSAYVNHVELVRRARKAEMPPSFYTDPLMYQGGSDSFIGPRDRVVANEAWGIDFEAEVAVVTGDVPLGASPEAAARAIRLVMLVNDVSLRNLIPNELAKGFGFFQSKPASAFSPVCVTPDELGPLWADC